MGVKGLSYCEGGSLGGVRGRGGRITINFGFLRRLFDGWNSSLDGFHNAFLVLRILDLYSSATNIIIPLSLAFKNSRNIFILFYWTYFSFIPKFV